MTSLRISSRTVYGHILYFVIYSFDGLAPSEIVFASSWAVISSSSNAIADVVFLFTRCYHSCSCLRFSCCYRLSSTFISFDYKSLIYGIPSILDQFSISLSVIIVIVLTPLIHLIASEHIQHMWHALHSYNWIEQTIIKKLALLLEL